MTWNCTSWKTQPINFDTNKEFWWIMSHSKRGAQLWNEKEHKGETKETCEQEKIWVSVLDRIWPLQCDFSIQPGLALDGWMDGWMDILFSSAVDVFSLCPWSGRSKQTTTTHDPLSSSSLGFIHFFTFFHATIPGSASTQTLFFFFKSSPFTTFFISSFPPDYTECNIIIITQQSMIEEIQQPFQQEEEQPTGSCPESHAWTKWVLIIMMDDT